MAAVTICNDFGAKKKKKKSLTVSNVSPSIWHEVIGPDAMILVFWVLSFKPGFSLFSFTFIRRLFSSSSLSAISMVSFACLRLLIFLSGILILAYASSSPVFCMMYSAYKLNKQGDNIQPWHTPFSVWNQSVVPCPVITVASNYCFQSHFIMENRGGKVEVVTNFLFLALKSLWMVIVAMKSEGSCFLVGKLWQT